MLKPTSNQYSNSFFGNSLVNFTTTILVLLITFNLGWLLMLIRLYSRLAVIRNLSKTILNLDSILLLGNLGILFLFIGYIFAMRNLRAILGKR